jgi:hypothetical protein
MITMCRMIGSMPHVSEKRQLRGRTPKTAVMRELLECG